MHRYIAGLLLLTCSFSAFAAEPTVTFDKAVPWTEMNAHFQPKEGWIGGDGAYSVLLPTHKRLWLFSDTWVGKIRNEKRVEASMVNNTAAIQDAKDLAKLQFAIRRNEDKKAATLITPADGRGWFWLMAAACPDKKLYLLMAQIEKTKDPGVFGFRQTDQVLGIVSNPAADPCEWKIEQKKIPFAFFKTDRALTYGVAILQNGNYLYIYGTDEEIQPKHKSRHLIVARVTVDKVEDFAAWQFYQDGTWGSEPRQSRHLITGMGSEGSVTYLSNLKKYFLVYTEGGLSDRILARTADAPTGPWSDSTVVYRCPEAGWDKRIFCYAAKAHDSLGDGNELVITYCTNSFDFWHAASDARIYYPRFIRIKVHAK